MPTRSTPSSRRAPVRLKAWLRGRPLVMGVLNVTPDSFFDGGRWHDPERAVHRGLALLEAGADLLDVGGQSTRPGSEPIPEREELDRVLPVVRSLARRGAGPISVDTSRAAVAEAALDLGAAVVNDVSAFREDPRMASLAARRGIPVILMHMQGRPKDMQKAPSYSDVVGEVERFLRERLKAFEAEGGDPAQAMIDPGIGFGKTLEHNLELLRAVPRLSRLAPVVIGASRKSFLGRLAAGERPGGRPLPSERLTPPEERLPGSLAAALFAASRGAAMLRVHDAGETAQALAVWRALDGGGA